MADANAPKKRSFRKFQYRGIELEALLDLKPVELTKLFPARIRRRFSRGLPKKYSVLLKKLRKAKKECPMHEKPEVVKPFVRSRGGGMSYPVAIDENKQTNQAWMKAAGRDGIPAAFLVSRDGKIAWIGHPADPAMLEIIPKLLAGKYDPVLEKQAAPLLDAANKAASRRNYRQAYTHLDKVIEMDPKVFSSVVLQRYELMLTGEKDTEAATAYLSTKIEEYGPDAGSLTEFATALVNDPDLRPRNLELAAAAAEAVNAAAPNQPDSLAVLAMVQFAQGDATAAIENQQRAWMMADPSVKAEFKKARDQYRTTARRSSSR